MMLNQGIPVGKEQMNVIGEVALHYFCSTALGKKPRNFGYFAVKEIAPGQFEIRFKKASYTISFT
jgi:hypothetical protein